MSIVSVPMDQREGWIWFDGEWVVWKEAQVHVLTHGLHYGTGVFEGIRAYQGKGFKLGAHVDRFLASGNAVDVPLPYSKGDLMTAMTDVLAKNNLEDAYIRPIAWRGAEGLGVKSDDNRVHVVIAAWYWPSYYGGDALSKGLRLTRTSWMRPDPRTVPVQAKATGLYLVGSLTKNQAHREGYDDVLMCDYRGYLAEASSANLFFVRGKEVHTPIPECFLNGITRQTVIEIAKGLGYAVVERHIPSEELKSFDEMFVTGTAAEVTSVGSVDEVTFRVGPVTCELKKAYSALVRG